MQKSIIKRVDKAADIVYNKEDDIGFLCVCSLVSCYQNGGNEMGTYEKVCSIIAEQLGIKTEAVSKESDVINDLGADSIDIVQLLMAMENEFGVTVSEDDADNLKTVGDIVSLIDSKN